MSTIDIFGELEQIQELDLSGLSFQGTNLRLNCGQVNTFQIEDRLGYIEIPEEGMRLTRITASDQSGKLVIRGENVLMGETIGLMGDEDTKSPLPPYTLAQLSVWRTYGHTVRWEFQNPRPEAVQNLRDLAQKAGFVPFVPTEREDREPYERAAGVEVMFDLIALNGANSSKRFEKGLPLASCVLVPDVRVGPNLTEYVNREEDTVQRATFTSFIDSMVPLMKAAIAAGAGSDAAAKRTSLNRLSTLTGYNAETDWPNRPTMGYVTPKSHDEITVFPDRDAQATSVEAIVEAATAQVEPQEAIPVSDEPFDS